MCIGLSKTNLLLLVVTFIWVSAEESNTEPEKEVLQYVRPSLDNLAHFEEPFHSQEEFLSSWVLSSAKKDGVDEDIAKYDGKWTVDEPKSSAILGDQALIYSSEAKHGAISAMLKKPFTFEFKPFIVQYEVRFQNKHECGGAYVKLLADTPELKLSEFGDKSEYTIMFGPDKCGGDSKLHFIFQHENPVTHKMEEKHAKKPTKDFGHIFDDLKTHVVRLTVKPDNSFEIHVDKLLINEGSLLHDMEPSVNPPKEIDDPEDSKPEDWDEREKIPDPEATKPEDWDEDAPKKIEDASATKPSGWFDDEPELVPDPAAVRPEDWDDEEDGEWEAPQINNPKCKESGCGEWKAPLIENPNYKGKWTPALIVNPKYKGIWAPKKIENPGYFEDNNPFAMKSVAAVGFELWSMQADITFDNIIIVDDVDLAEQWTRQTWDLKHQEEVAAEPSAVAGLWNTVKEATDERPWLWIIVVIALLLPILLIYFFCFGGKEDKDAIRKKTDEVTPDDVDEDKEEEKDDAEEGSETPSEPEVESQPSEESKEDESEEETKKDEVKPSLGENVIEDDVVKVKGESEEKEEVKQDEVSPSPRTRSTRRKTRKE